MPIREPKSKPKVDPTPAPTAAPGVTLDDVEAMLATRDAQWAGQLASMSQSFAAALAKVLDAAKPAAPTPAPRKGTNIRFNYDTRGALVGAEVTPKE